ASLGSTIPGVKALSIANGGKEVEVNAKTVQSGQYPLARQLYLLVNQSPDKSLAPGVAQFLRYILSQQGQYIVRQLGYFPISSNQQQAQLNNLFQTSG
ncbi:MAG: substrate-binding domain-containing protein, partial [Glaciecola sp.]